MLELEAALDASRAQLRASLQQLDLQAQKLAKQEVELEWFRKKVFGRSSEKLRAPELGQLLLQFERVHGREPAGTEGRDGEGKTEWQLVRRKKPKKKGHGRTPIPDGLPRIVIPHELPPEERLCPCCGEAMGKIGSEETKVLEHQPAAFFVVVHDRAKYACSKQSCELATAPVLTPPPPLPIEKGKAGPGLLAQVLTAKFADHLPLERQQTIYRRGGVEIATTTMVGWVKQCARLLAPVVAAMQREVLGSKVIHTDDTHLLVLEPGEKTPANKGYFWVYRGDELHPYVIFDYTPKRSREGPERILAGYRGYLQADAFGGYDGMFKLGEVIEVACWAHARRKFVDARDCDKARADFVLQLIRELYAIEDEAKDLDGNARRALRQAKARPRVEELGEWIEAELPRLLPQGPMAEAYRYARNQWAALNRYLGDGDLSIDNNVSERELRSIAVGRKNWNFAGSEDGARHSATVYSLIASAKRHGLDPLAYLRSLLTEVPMIPEDEREQRIGELLPDRWKAETERVPGAPAPRVR